MIKKTNSGLKIICLNRKARFNFFFTELIEAGIVLKGSEIKSVRSGKVNIAESYAVEKSGEIYLVNSHIPIYKQASYTNHNPYSERKLLFSKKEIKLTEIKIKRISKPGIRVYSKIKELPKPFGWLGISILSTPKGIMSDQKARDNNVGVEVLCEVF